jgi:hypothetical protein
MNEEYSSKHYTLFYISFIIIAIITFFPFFSTGFGNADDVQNYLVVRKGQIIQNAFYAAQMSGRFYYYLVAYVMGIPFLSDNIFITKLFHLIPILTGVLLFAKILYDLTKSRELAFLYFLIFMVIAQISGHTSLFLTYSFYFTFSFDLLLLSFILLLKYLENHKKWILILSSLSYAIGLLFYETYLFYSLVFAIIILVYDLKKGDRYPTGLKNAIFHFLPFFIVNVLYLVIYFVFRIYYPSKYEGSSFATAGITVGSFFNVLWSLSNTAFPLRVWETSRDIFTGKSELVPGFSPVVLDVIIKGRVEWIVKGILVGYCGYKLLTMIPRVKHKFLLGSIAIAVLLIFMPQIPLALTPKYNFYVKYGMIGYIPTYFSLFGVVFILSILFGYLSGLLTRYKILKRFLTIIVVTGFFICSFLTDFSNYTIAKDVRSGNLRFYAMEDLIKSEKFQKIPGGSNIYAPDLYNNPSYSARNLTEQSFNWSDFIGLKSGTYFNIYREEKDLIAMLNDTTRPVYYFTMQQSFKGEDVMLAIANIDRPAQNDTLKEKLTDKALVSYYSPYKIFTVSFRFKDPAVAKEMSFHINHIPGQMTSGNEIQLTIYNTKQYQTSTIFTIEIQSLDVNSIMISNIVNPRNPVFYL